MRASLTILVVLVACVACAQTLAPNVSVENGNIFFEHALGRRIQLTASGLDADPTVSPNMSWIAFVRRTPDDVIETGHPGLPDSNEIWIVRSDGSSSPQMLIRGRTGSFDVAQPETLVLANFFQPQFSVDGSQL